MHSLYVTKDVLLCAKTMNTYLICIASQAYDIIMDENKPLRNYTEAELSEDPLIVLHCGHVLPMTSLLGHLELHKVYDVDSQADWKSPLPLKVHLCPCLLTCCLISSDLHLPYV